MKTKINNKNGFVLAETLVVIIFVLIIFTVLYNSAVPLLGRYDELSYYDDLDTTYDVYQYKKIFESDSNYSNIANNHYKKLTCSDIIDNTNKCSQLNNYLNVVNQDTLLYFNSNYLEEIKNDESISYEIKDYLDYLKLESDINILLLEHEGYISYIELAAIVDSNYIKKEIIKKDEVCKTYVEKDRITYISGTKECIDFNYVWWSGKLWRITAIYPDGAMKMVTDNVITSISYNGEEDNVSYYTKADETNGIAEFKSYMFQWLNEDFLDTLYNEGRDVIDTTKYWNATISGNTTETEAAMIPTTTSPVGLLNSYEYYKSYENTSYSNGYLNIGYYWWLLNSHNSSDVRCVGANGTDYDYGPFLAFGTRPSIYLKSGLSLTGSGTKMDPYKIIGDMTSGTENQMINTRMSGEYVKIKYKDVNQVEQLSPLYRIVGIEKSPLDNTKMITKLVAMDYADNGATKKFATENSSGIGTIYGSGNTIDSERTTWYSYLNGTDTNDVHNNDGWFDGLGYNSLLTKGTYYMGNGDIVSLYNYKGAICATSDINNKTKSCSKTANKGDFNVGLLRYGEMFATQQRSSSSSVSMWLITKCDSLSVRNVSSGGDGYDFSPTITYGARPTVHLKSEVKILSGSGTELDPYVVGL